jgi:hypothetical protein
MRRLGVVVVSYVGFWVIAYGIECLTIPTQYSVGANGRLELFPRLLLTLPAVFLLLFGVVLIVYRKAISHSLIEDGDDKLVFSATALLTAGVALTGVQVLARALPTLASDLVRPYLMRAYSPSGFQAGDGPSEWLFVVRSFVFPATQLALGAVLCLKARILAAWLLREPKTATEGDLPVCPRCGTPYDPRDYDAHSAALCGKCGQPLDLPSS